jgi:hypothetical protein
VVKEQSTHAWESDYNWLQLEELEDVNGLCVLLINIMSFYVKIIYIYIYRRLAVITANAFVILGRLIIFNAILTVSRRLLKGGYFARKWYNVIVKEKI